MAHRLKTAAGKSLYKLRKQTVEPVFGIIKEVMGFRRFLLRGPDKMSLEWVLVCLSCNHKRLFALKIGRWRDKTEPKGSGQAKKQGQ